MIYTCSFTEGLGRDTTAHLESRSISEDMPHNCHVYEALLNLIQLDFFAISQVLFVLQVMHKFRDAPPLHNRQSP